MKQLITLLMRSGLSLKVPQSARSIELKIRQSMDMVSRAIEKAKARQVTAPKPAGPESTSGPESGKPPAPSEKTAAAASTPKHKVLEGQPKSALKRLRRMRSEENANAPDRR